MPIHTDKYPSKSDKAPLWVKPWHVKSNKKGGEIADAAADMHRIPNDKALPMFSLLRNLNLAQGMLIAVRKDIYKGRITKP